MPSLTSSLLREPKIIFLYGVHERWMLFYLKCRLATNMRDAKTNENFEKVDKGYVLDAARAAKVGDASQHQRLVYVSVSLFPLTIIVCSTADTIAVSGTVHPSQSPA